MENKTTECYLTQTTDRETQPIIIDVITSQYWHYRPLWETGLKEKLR